MKKITVTLLIATAVPFFFSLKAKAQSTELVQLILNVEKLSQLKSILDEMYKGYQTLSTGYSTVKDLAEGNFNIHKLFLDGLLAVSPTVKNYSRISDIISRQKSIISEYKSAMGGFKQMNVFTAESLSNIQKVYDNLVSRSLDDLSELVMVVTAGELRMSDAERIKSIDRIYTSVNGELLFLRGFNNSTSLLAVQKKKSLQDLETLQSLYAQ